MVREMSGETQFLFISHNKITMEMANQLIGITMPEPGVSRVVAVDIAEAVGSRPPARPRWPLPDPRRGGGVGIVRYRSAGAYNSTDGASRIRRGPARGGGARDWIPMSPMGRPEGESDPERESAKDRPVSPMGRPEGESGPERESAKGRPVSPMGRPEGESGPERAARRVVK